MNLSAILGALEKAAPIVSLVAKHFAGADVAHVADVAAAYTKAARRQHVIAACAVTAYFKPHVKGLTGEVAYWETFGEELGACGFRDPVAGVQLSDAEKAVLHAAWQAESIADALAT